MAFMILATGLYLNAWCVRAGMIARNRPIPGASVVPKARSVSPKPGTCFMRSELLASSAEYHVTEPM